MASQILNPRMIEILTQAGLLGCEKDPKGDIKMAVVGNKGAGKSSFIQCFILDHGINPELNEPRMWIKTVGYGGPKNEFTFVLRELPAHENLLHIRAQAYLEAQVVVICYSVADRESWEAIPKWFEESRQYLPEAKVFVVGCKMEQRKNEEPVSRKEGKDMARSIGAEKYYEISAYTGNKVDDMVLSMEQRLMP